jgi:hypothetical protein
MAENLGSLESKSCTKEKEKDKEKQHSCFGIIAWMVRTSLR